VEVFSRRYEHITSRPLLAGLPFLVAGLLIPQNPWFFVLALGCLPFAIRNLKVAFALLVIGLARSLLSPAPPDPMPAGEFTAIGRVVSTPSLGLRTQRMVLDLGDRQILLITRSSRLVMAGDHVRAVGRLESVSPASDPYGQGAYWRHRGILQKMDIAWDGAMEVLSPGFGPAAWGSAWRTETWNRMRRNLPIRAAGISTAIIAGQQGLVDKDLVTHMQRAGTLHLLATSGYNVLLLAAALMFLLSHLPMPRIWQVAIALLLLLAYADAVGGRPPVIRAVIMAAAYLGVFAFRRSPDALSALGLAGIGYLLIEPAGVFDAGFHLSFAAAGGLILFMPRAYSGMKAWAEARQLSPAARLVGFWAGNAVAATSVAEIATLPLLAAHFGVISVVAPVANLLTAAAVPAVYIGSVSSQLADMFSPVVSRGFDLMITGSSAGWVDSVNTALGSLPWAAVSTPLWPWPLVAGYYVALVLLSRPERRAAEQA
jgi:competence protein ComEC